MLSHYTCNVGSNNTSFEVVINPFNCLIFKINSYVFIEKLKGVCTRKTLVSLFGVCCLSQVSSDAQAEGVALSRVFAQSQQCSRSSGPQHGGGGPH